ncbi:hypothetical protein [Streptacidiphilus sp. P02-A3a]|uniref:hypothetical protein n=1 Tax=Streptacidiphilus sp. P02-A3a TaxID=2704468 RepID=UPI0015F8A4D1|nr:hypothetical protein [Streptacidiphilus sp. P02-A3a]QMU68391.1 hypothetical protein GXP74_09275 [Streptacidiphilus sp. P02-A3a]
MSHHRRLIATAAMLAAGVVAVPSTAAAAAPSPVGAAARPVAAGASALPKALSAGFRTFTSPASDSERGQGVPVGATSSQGVAATPDPTLRVGLTGTTDSAYGLNLVTSVTGAAGVPLTVTVAWGDGSTSTATLTGSGNVTSDHTYPQVGAFKATVTVTDGRGDTVTNSLSGVTAGSDLTPFGPTRLLDTGTGLGAPKAKVGPDSVLRLRIGGNHGIPTGVTAAVLNVTVADPTSSGHLSAYADGTALPATSNINFVAGQTVPNQVVVTVGADGYVDLYNASGGTVNLITDIAGYFSTTAASGYTPITPHRLLDTRKGIRVAQAQVPGHSSITALIAGAHKGVLPATGVTAVALNITASGAKGAGFLSVVPDGVTSITTSNVNFGANQTIANAAIAPVGADGRIRVYNGSALPTDIVVDVVGYYSAASRGAYVPLPPTRLLDTAAPAVSALPGGDYLHLALNVAWANVTSWVLNTTVTDTATGGSLAVGWDPNTQEMYLFGSAGRPATPLYSSLNWTRGETVANLVQARPGPYGLVDFWNTGTGSTDLLVDAFGMYENR